MKLNNEQKLALARLIVLLITLVNSVLAHYGKPIIKTDEAFVYQVISDAILIGSIAWAYWKNNNITKNAAKAQEFKKQLDKGEVEFEGPEVVTEKSEVEVDNTKGGQ
ncbi:phage holin [Macrococcus hajekii]|uniref:Phage holin n=1 Tax=Macrococcus hajekii TaxID=198482 RepID=A0A4R6BNS4_9STAP|nr:phage holin [Macrococcus hajekii]